MMNDQLQLTLAKALEVIPYADKSVEGFVDPAKILQASEKRSVNQLNLLVSLGIINFSDIIHRLQIIDQKISVIEMDLKNLINQNNEIKYLITEMPSAIRRVVPETTGKIPSDKPTEGSTRAKLILQELLFSKERDNQLLKTLQELIALTNNRSSIILDNINKKVQSSEGTSGTSQIDKGSTLTDNKFLIQ